MVLNQYKSWQRSTASVILLALFAVSVTVAGSPSLEAQDNGLDSSTSGGAGGPGPGEYEITIAGQPALVIVGESYDSNQPTHLAYYLHGDEGGYDFLTNFNSEARQLIDDRGWIFIAPRAPAKGAPGNLFYPWDGSGGGDLATNQATNAAQVSAAIEWALSAYNVYRYRILGAGVSGGSWFHDMVFVPTRGSQYPTYFLLGCGAGGLAPGGFNYTEAQAVATDQRAIANSELHYYIGTDDFLFGGAQTSSATYTALGFDVETTFLGGVQHCAFDASPPTASYWSSVADSLGAPPQLTCGGLTVTVDLSLGGTPTQGNDVILGTPGNDAIAAGSGDDVICGLAGNDTIWGQAGADVIIGGPGNDRLRGGDGFDEVRGERGDDDLNGGRGNDRVFGGDGVDRLRGGTGNDLVDGGPGDDPLVAGNGGEDAVSGGEGNDKVTGGPRPDTLLGGAGNDELRGLGGADTLFGGSGNDSLFGSQQPDTLDGGPGTDMCNGGTTGGGAIESDTAVACEGTVSNVP